LFWDSKPDLTWQGFRGMTKKLSKNELEEITARTLRHYDEKASSFWEGTRDHDVSQNYEAFLSALPQGLKLNLLELGCGPGRDVLYFKKLGHEVEGLDGSIEFCKMARSYTGCTIHQQNFLELNLPSGKYHGIFANASLFHVPRQEMVRVLKDLYRALKLEGILFTSNPKGDVEGWMGNRYGTYMELAYFEGRLQKAGFRIIHHYFRPKDLPPEEQHWLAIVSQKK
jgi:SAM-dependent methyltransferase